MGLAMFVATVTVADSVAPTPTEARVPHEVVAIAEASTMEEEVVVPTATTKEQVHAYFSDVPILAEVARCESEYRQFDENGQVLRGKVNGQDVGVMQINEHYHLATAQKLGLNIHTLEGNMAYARFLYESEGTRPWNYSSACWSKSREVALR